jgi:hypothetical protein
VIIGLAILAVYVAGLAVTAMMLGMAGEKPTDSSMIFAWLWPVLTIVLFVFAVPAGFAYLGKRLAGSIHHE